MEKNLHSELSFITKQEANELRAAMQQLKDSIDQLHKEIQRIRKDINSSVTLTPNESLSYKEKKEITKELLSNIREKGLRDILKETIEEGRKW